MKRQEERYVNKICRQKKRTDMNKMLLEIEEKFQGRHISEAYKEIKTTKEGFKPHTDICRNEVGEIIGQREKYRVGGWNILQSC
jgi:hypothetical protein